MPAGSTPASTLPESYTHALETYQPSPLNEQPDDAAFNPPEPQRPSTSAQEQTPRADDEHSGAEGSANAPSDSGPATRETSWADDEEVRATASRFGLSDEDMKAFPSRDDFDRHVVISNRAALRQFKEWAKQQAGAEPSGQQPASQPPDDGQPAKPQSPPSKKSFDEVVEELVRDDLLDEGLKAALGAMRDELKDLRQFREAARQQEQLAAQREAEAEFETFDQMCDGMASDILGHRQKGLSPEQQQARQKVWEDLYAFRFLSAYQTGQVPPISDMGRFKDAFHANFWDQIVHQREQGLVRKLKESSSRRLGEPAPVKDRLPAQGEEDDNADLIALFNQMASGQYRR